MEDHHPPGIRPGCEEGKQVIMLASATLIHVPVALGEPIASRSTSPSYLTLQHFDAVSRHTCERRLVRSAPLPFLRPPSWELEPGVAKGGARDSRQAYHLLGAGDLLPGLQARCPAASRLSLLSVSSWLYCLSPDVNWIAPSIASK